MNSSQKFGLFILIVITVLYVYFSFFGKDFKLPDFISNYGKTQQEYNPVENKTPETETPEVSEGKKIVKIFLLDKNGNIRSLNRECDKAVHSSCFEFAVKELISAPSNWEKSKGFTSEIPAGTKLLSVRESSGNILIDLSSDFESGGGAESTYMRIKQVIKTVNNNTSKPVFLYINGKQAEVIGGEGVMLKQPLNERSLDE